MRGFCCQNYGAVLGLDPRTTRSVCRVENGPRIKSEGSPVEVDDFVLNGEQI